jgi:hypothetical protein
MIILRQKDYSAIGEYISTNAIKNARHNVAETGLKAWRKTTDPKTKEKILKLVGDAKSSLKTKKNAGMNLNTAIWAKEKGRNVSIKLQRVTND